MSTLTTLVDARRLRLTTTIDGSSEKKLDRLSLATSLRIPPSECRRTMANPSVTRRYQFSNPIVDFLGVDRVSELENVTRHPKLPADATSSNSPSMEPLLHHSPTPSTSSFSSFPTTSTWIIKHSSEGHHLHPAGSTPSFIIMPSEKVPVIEISPESPRGPGGDGKPRPPSIIVPPPSPCAQPLLNKPEPRLERFQGVAANTFPRHRSRDEQVKNSMEIFTKAHRKAEDIISLSGSLSKSFMGRSIDSQDPMGGPGHLYAKSLRERESMAIEIAASHQYVQEWGFYLKNYVEGCFNVNNPPLPPPRNAKFNHLPALTPPDELKRIEVYKKIFSLYPRWAMANAIDDYHTAKRLLRTEHASLSVLDRKHEIMRVESGYNRAMIPRHDSLGAHVLIGKDMMIVLDTHKDWRFKHHPLVTGPPYIRFFAAVPILAETGEVMGVFAVFDERPKKTFDRKARDILDSFGRDLTGDFRHLTFKEKGWSLLHGKDHVMTGVPNSKLRFYGMLMRERPEGYEAPHREEPRRIFRRCRGNNSLTMGSRSPRVPEDDLEAIMSHIKELQEEEIREAINPHNEELQEVETSPSVKSQTTTSIDSADNDHRHHHRRRRNRHQLLGQMTVDTGAGDRQSVIDIDEIERKATPIKRAHRLSIIEIRPEAIREANYMISLIAKSQGWDLIYVLQILPGWKQNIAPNEDVKARMNRHRRHIRLILSYDLETCDWGFSLRLHLQALRSAGGISFNEKKTRDDDGIYESGLLLPMARDPLDENDQRLTSPVSLSSLNSPISTGLLRLAITSTGKGIVVGGGPKENNNGEKQDKSSGDETGKEDADVGGKDKKSSEDIGGKEKTKTDEDTIDDKGHDGGEWKKASEATINDDGHHEGDEEPRFEEVEDEETKEERMLREPDPKVESGFVLAAYRKYDPPLSGREQVQALQDLRLAAQRIKAVLGMGKVHP